MFIYIIYTFLFLFLYKFYKNRHVLNQPYAIYKIYKNTVDKDNSIGHCGVICSLLYTIISYYPLTYMYKRSIPEKFNKKYIKISYKYNDKSYFYLLKVPRGVTPLKTIEDEEGNDVSDVISPYLGPNLDCHNVSIYPRDFGYKSLKITTIFDKIVVFAEDEKISLVE